MMIDQSIKNAIYAHVITELPREGCGVLHVVDGQTLFHACRNIAEGTDNFAIHPEDYAAAESMGEIVGIVHSHPNGPAEFSQADRVACEASGLPWYLVTCPEEAWAYMEPSGYIAPLVGRVWAHGVLDCYSIIRDWYKQERGITLPDFERHDDWWHKGGNLYVENFSKAGFERVFDGPQVGDVLLMQVLAKVPNHAAVYIGDNKILHHLHGRLSCRDVIGGYWSKNTTHILRYVG